MEMLPLEQSGQFQKKKDNYYAKRLIGWGPSSYIFDYIDEVLEKRIVFKFWEVVDLAKKVALDPTYKDPYTLENILGQQGTEEVLLASLKSLQPTFDEAVWRSSITVSQVNALLNEWKWFKDATKADYAKFFVDKYDFNGDGRLSPREFIIGNIRNNKAIIGTGTCKFCFEEIIKDTIDPIFMHLDCKNEEKINAESIWTGLKTLKRPDEKSDSNNKFNFYNCQYGNGLGRTNVPNDFVVKGQKTMDGFLSKTEFRLSVLQGYWARHVNDLGIIVDHKQSLRGMRWLKEGVTDVVCANLTGKTQ